MGRVTTVTYECDWCERPDRDDEGGDFDGAPKTWAEVGYELLCPECQEIRWEALASAKAHRKMTRTGQSVCVPHKSVAPKDDA
jgi:rubredoxin